MHPEFRFYVIEQHLYRVGDLRRALNAGIINFREGVRNEEGYRKVLDDVWRIAHGFFGLCERRGRAGKIR